MIVIGLVGLQGSGKTETVKVLERLGAEWVRMGDVVWKELEKRGQEINEANVGRLAEELRKVEGMGAVAKRCVPIIREKKSDVVVVDGIRGIAEVEEFRKAFGDDFHLWAVWASERDRYSRIAGRKRQDDVTGLDALRSKDRRELGWGLGEAFALAEVMIVNDGSLEDLRKKVEKAFLETVGKVEGKS
ncbi:MAG: AAA family ATPase [Candidatus Hadarchaeales archaeon]